MSVAALIAKREMTHGSFRSNARISQALKRLVRAEKQLWETLTDVQREAIDAIFVKIARILSGDPRYADHWDDIMGYADRGKRGP